MRSELKVKFFSTDRICAVGRQKFDWLEHVHYKPAHFTTTDLGLMIAQYAKPADKKKRPTKFPREALQS